MTNAFNAPTTRRSFLRRLGGVALAAVAAPLVAKFDATPTEAATLLSAPQSPIAQIPRPPVFIPSTHLDAVPRNLITDATELQDAIRQAQAARVLSPPSAGQIPMLLLNDTYYSPLGGHLTAGNTVTVNRYTAGRWVDFGVAVPAPGYNVEPDTTRRVLEAARAHEYRNIEPFSGPPESHCQFTSTRPWRNEFFREDILASRTERPQFTSEFARQFHEEARRSLSGPPTGTPSNGISKTVQGLLVR